MISNEEMTRIENTFKERCINIHKIKFESKKFYDLQCEYFVGAMAALNEQPIKWSTCIMASRPIITY